MHATDLSGADESAFAHALGIALLRQAKFTILHVTPNASAADWSGFPAVRRTLERWKLLDPGSAQEDVFAKLGMKVRKLAIESRFAALAVARHLDSQPADLLVVATEGREGVARWLRGSVAEAMARWSQTMTLFVPADAERNIVSPADGNLTLKNVLIPVDHSPDASAAIKFARRAAEVMSDEKVTITLLHIGDETAMPMVYAQDGPQAEKRRGTQHRGAGRRQLDAQERIDVPSIIRRMQTHAIEFADAAQQKSMSDEESLRSRLLHIGDESGNADGVGAGRPQWTFARMHTRRRRRRRDRRGGRARPSGARRDADRGRNGWFDALRGSTTERVLRCLRCPLLAVPAPRR